MSYRVYVSYSVNDSVLAEDLKRRLKDAGLNFTTVAGTSDVEAGDLRRYIRSLISGTSEVIALLTDNSASSRWVMYEVGIADSLDIPVTFVVVSEDVVKQLPIVGKNFVRYADLPEYLSSLKKRAKAA